MDRFQRPVNVLNQQDQFSSSEVGLTHPETPSYIKLRDNGSIEISAEAGVGIVLHNGTITLIADRVRFLTKDDGLQWNSLVFNHRSTTPEEPAFLMVPEEEAVSIYRGASEYLQKG